MNEIKIIGDKVFFRGEEIPLNTLKADILRKVSSAVSELSIVRSQLEVLTSNGLVGEEELVQIDEQITFLKCVYVQLKERFFPEVIKEKKPEEAKEVA